MEPRPVDRYLENLRGEQDGAALYDAVATRGATAVIASLAISALALFGLGAGITLFTARPAVRSGLRSVLFGLVAAGGTWAIGRLIGVTVS